MQKDELGPYTTHKNEPKMGQRTEKVKTIEV
jgi:hypothetical protein